MKRRYLLLIITLLFTIVLTGCGSSDDKKVSCTMDAGEEEITNWEIFAQRDDKNKVSKIYMEFDFTTSDAAANYLVKLNSMFGDSAKISGKKITIDSLETSVYSKYVGYTKDNFFDEIISTAKNPSKVKCE